MVYSSGYEVGRLRTAGVRQNEKYSKNSPLSEVFLNNVIALRGSPDLVATTMNNKTSQTKQVKQNKSNKMRNKIGIEY
jgi:hypothetical protein